VAAVSFKWLNGGDKNPGLAPVYIPDSPAAASGRWSEKTGGLEYEITRVQKLNVYDKYTKNTR